MTIEELSNKVVELERQIGELNNKLNLTYNQNLTLNRGLINVKSATATKGVYFVAETSGGSPTRKLTFYNGILISDTN